MAMPDELFEEIKSKVPQEHVQYLNRKSMDDLFDTITGKKSVKPIKPMTKRALIDVKSFRSPVKQASADFLASVAKFATSEDEKRIMAKFPAAVIKNYQDGKITAKQALATMNKFLKIWGKHKTNMSKPFRKAMNNLITNAGKVIGGTLTGAGLLALGIQSPKIFNKQGNNKPAGGGGGNKPSGGGGNNTLVSGGNF